MMSFYSSFETETQEKTEVKLDELVNRELIVHNDDVNTFDWVIESLISVCGHNKSQAEQLTLLVHYKGKARVKKGSLERLKPMKEALLERKITATID